MASQLKIGKKNTFQISMEEDETNTDVEVTEPPEGYEENEDEVVETANELDQNTSDLDSGLDEMEEFGVIKDQAVKAVNDGDGFSEREAEGAEVSLEHIYRRLGYKKPVSRPSLEDYGSKNSRLETTKKFVLSLEADEKSLWEKFKAFCAKIWDMIVDSIKSIFSNSEKTYKWADELLKAANALKGKTSDTKTISNPAIARAFSSDHVTPNGNDVIKLLTSQQEITSKIFPELNECLVESNKLYQDYTVNEDKLSPEALNEKITAVFDNCINKIPSIQRDKEKGTFKAGPFINNKCIVFGTSVKGKLSTSWDNFFDTRDKNPDKEIPVIQPDQAVTICMDVKKLIETNKKAKEEMDAFKKTLDESVAVMKRIVDSDTSKNTSLKTAQANITGTINAIYKINYGLPTLNLLASNKALTYVKASLDVFKSTKEEKEKA